MVLARGRVAVLVSVALVGGLLVVPALNGVAHAAVQTVAISIDHAASVGPRF